jgi:hypothetical protein
VGSGVGSGEGIGVGSGVDSGVGSGVEEGECVTGELEITMLLNETMDELEGVGDGLEDDRTTVDEDAALLLETADEL